MNTSSLDPGALDLSRVGGILFDVDGTLSDTDDHWVERFTRLLKPFAGLFEDRDPRRFARWVVMSVETPANFFYSLADRLGIDKPLFNLFNWLFKKNRSRRLPKDRFWMIPGIRELLADLHQHYPLAVVSARDEAATLVFLDLFELTPFFDTIVTAHTTEHTKPFPEPVEFAAAALGLAPEECLMVGDTIVDVKAGRLAGAQTVAVLCGFGQKPELERAGADIVLNHTTDLKSLLQ
jgi:HAD superfamily hydrolase (TIGR01509 family)